MVFLTFSYIDMYKTNLYLSYILLHSAHYYLHGPQQKFKLCEIKTEYLCYFPEDHLHGFLLHFHACFIQGCFYFAIWQQ